MSGIIDGIGGNNEMYCGMSDVEVSELKASMEDILKKNPFGLVYNKALTDNVPGKINIRPVSYQNHQGITIAANLYLPAGYDKSGSYAAITCAHPNGGVKEQVAGLFAQRLAENGYITIAFDAAYQGASGGTPRQLDKAYSRVEDIRSAIDFLMTVPGVDTNRIDALASAEEADIRSKSPRQIRESRQLPLSVCSTQAVLGRMASRTRISRVRRAG